MLHSPTKRKPKFTTRTTKFHLNQRAHEPINPKTNQFSNQNDLRIKKKSIKQRIFESKALTVTNTASFPRFAIATGVTTPADINNDAFAAIVASAATPCLASNFPRHYRPSYESSAALIFGKLGFLLKTNDEDLEAGSFSFTKTGNSISRRLFENKRLLQRKLRIANKHPPHPAY